MPSVLSIGGYGELGEWLAVVQSISQSHFRAEAAPGIFISGVWGTKSSRSWSSLQTLFINFDCKNDQKFENFRTRTPRFLTSLFHGAAFRGVGLPQAHGCAATAVSEILWPNIIWSMTKHYKSFVAIFDLTKTVWYHHSTSLHDSLPSELHSLCWLEQLMSSWNGMSATTRSHRQSSCQCYTNSTG